MKLNINEIVRVKLNDSGAKIYNDWLGSEGHKEGGDYLSMQMWALMQCFGPHVHIGMSEIPFQDNQIEIMVIAKEQA